jgi:hypothetical protein
MKKNLAARIETSSCTKLHAQGWFLRQLVCCKMYTVNILFCNLLNLLCLDSTAGRVCVLFCVFEVRGGFLGTGGGALTTERGGSYLSQEINYV